MLKSIIYLYQTEGLAGIVHRINRKLFKVKIDGFESLKDFFIDKTALEIGGPSPIFKSGAIMPLYKLLKRVDGCNFSSSTVWEGNISQGENYKYETDKKGYQYIAEAVDLSQISDNSYDVLLSCHSLEHIANPIKALKEWLRVLKKDGIIVLVLPDPKYTFDHKRPLTTIAHLITDYENNVNDNDLTHAEEIIKLHDLTRDPFSVNNGELPKEWVLNNKEHRCLHHHVFSTELLKEILVYLNLKIIKVDQERPFHLVAIAQKNN